MADKEWLEPNIFRGNGVGYSAAEPKNLDDLVVKKIKDHFPEAVVEVNDFREERTIVVEMEQIKSIAMLLRDDEDLLYNFIVDVVADDMLPDYPRFAINYSLRSMKHRHDIRLRTFVEDPDEGPESLGEVWKIATWLEMEVWDLMGIRFSGNTSLRRLFLPEDWAGHPLRKDYPLGYEEVQFSFNWEAIQAKKPYAGRKELKD